MDTKTQAIVAFLALIFVISGLSKASGNEKGLSGTRDVNVADGFARVVGTFEALFALGGAFLLGAGLAYVVLRRKKRAEI